jgi:hypothetical protein
MDSRVRLRSMSSRTYARGQAAVILLLLLVLGVVALVYGMATPAKESIERDKRTAAALAQAKEALLGFAAGIDLTAGGSPRPGDLPCPDIDNDGTADTPCAGGALGRLPWQRLGLPDLRDGDGERLWYAVSSNFKNNPRTACGTPGLTTCLNSDTRGTITVRSNTGAVINNGNDPWASHNPSGVIAVIIAPRAVLRRQGAAGPQDRSCTVGVNCDANERCTTSPPSLTPRCNALNYLDTVTGTEDNADFVDGSAINGFINGDVLAGGNVIVNDRILTITYADLMPLLEKRVAKEALNCLNAYASVPQNGGRYPWAVPVANWPSFADQTGTQFGRLPDGPFSATLLGLGGSVTNLICSITPFLCMFNGWPASCSLTAGTWWTNWKEVVFYGVAVAYQPADSLLGVPPSGGCGNCLSINPLPGANKRVTVIVAGKRLAAVGGGQPRASAADKSNPSNYAEDENNNAPAPANVYVQQSSTPTFNDVLLFQQ